MDRLFFTTPSNRLLFGFFPISGGFLCDFGADFMELTAAESIFVFLLSTFRVFRDSAVDNFVALLEVIAGVCSGFVSHAAPAQF